LSLFKALDSKKDESSLTFNQLSTHQGNKIPTMWLMRTLRQKLSYIAVSFKKK